MSFHFSSVVVSRLVRFLHPLFKIKRFRYSLFKKIYPRKKYRSLFLHEYVLLVSFFNMPFMMVIISMSMCIYNACEMHDIQFVMMKVNSFSLVSTFEPSPAQRPRWAVAPKNLNFTNFLGTIAGVIYKYSCKARQGFLFDVQLVFASSFSLRLVISKLQFQFIIEI